MKIRFQGRSLTDAVGPLAKCYSIPLVCHPIDAIKTVASCRTKLFQKSKAEKVFLFLQSLSSLSRTERRGADTVPAIWSIFWTGRTLYKESVGKSTSFIFFHSPLVCSKLSGTSCSYRVSDNWRAEEGILSSACSPSILLTDTRWTIYCVLHLAEISGVNILKFTKTLKVFHCHFTYLFNRAKRKTRND